MNVDWVKIPTLLWGVEIIYHRVIYVSVFDELENRLNRTQETLQFLENENLSENSGVTFDFDDDFEKVSNSKEEIIKNKKWIKWFKSVSSILTLILPVLTMGVIFYNSLIEVLISSRFSPYVSPSFSPCVPSIPNLIILIYCFQYLFRVTFAFWWPLKAWLKFLLHKRSLDGFMARVAPVDI